MNFTELLFSFSANMLSVCVQADNFILVQKVLDENQLLIPEANLLV